MFVLPIIDLWTGRPAAYALTDSKGAPVSARSPRELYLNIHAAMERNFTPLVVCRPKSMKDAAWNKFIQQLPQYVWQYDNGEVTDRDQNVVMIEQGEAETLWIRDINHKGRLTSLMEAGVHYGSGGALMGVDELEIATSAMYRIAWG